METSISGTIRPPVHPSTQGLKCQHRSIQCTTRKFVGLSQIRSGADP